jgi:uncharacterized protein (TIGR00730 family)
VCGGDPESFEGELVRQMVSTSLKLMVGKHDTGQIKLMNRALKEMRYAYRIFTQYNGKPNISIFGSARTPEDHPDYIAAKEFSRLIAKEGWRCITGAANGIMKAGLEGSEKEASFGLSIRLPFETVSNSVIEGDPKLITFRYFFTRKLMFLSHSNAVAAFPGGVGTLDELFEVLTLIQTGKTNIMPIVLVEGKGGVYWKNWEQYLKRHLLKNGWISPEDLNLYYIAKNPNDAVMHVLKFYKRYHSYRYVKDNLVIRTNEKLTADQLKILNREFTSLFKVGQGEFTDPLPEESDHLELPRIAFHHTRRDMGLVRMMIDRINSF